MKHLETVNMSYFGHMKVAFIYSFELSLAAMVLAIHAFIPCIFESTGSRIVNRVQGRMNHGPHSVKV